MRPRSLDDVAAVTSGAISLPPGGSASEVRVAGVAIDSRRVHSGDLFVALSGARTDGHRFIADAFERGAAAALVRAAAPRQTPLTGPLVAVEDPGRALLELASDERNHLAACVAGITGSTGKTSTKDLTAGVLAQRLRVVASQASYNNELGVPLTLLSADDDTEAVICEIGTRGPGEIRALCGVARPRVGVVTNVGTAHMEMFGSPEALRDAKAELPESLPAEGVAILPADDLVGRSFSRRTRASVVLFGTSAEAEVRAEGVSLDEGSGLASFDLVTAEGRARVRLPVPGEHMVSNALAAAAVGRVLGVPVDECARGLEGASVTGGRMEVIEAPGGIRVINDAYNASPASMAAALRAARWMARPGRSVAVLGHMAELGAISSREHERVGELVARIGIDELVVVGEPAGLIATAAEREGVERERIHRCPGAAEALPVVRSLARAGDVILVKASRVDRLDRLASALAGLPSDLTTVGGGS